MEETEKPTVQDFVKEREITIHHELLSHRLDSLMDDDPKHPMIHLLCTLRMKDRELKAPYSMGMAHVTEGSPLSNPSGTPSAPVLAQWTRDNPGKTRIRLQRGTQPFIAVVRYWREQIQRQGRGAYLGTCPFSKRVQAAIIEDNTIFVSIAAVGPAPWDLLDSLANDAVGVENARSFEEWASDYGYDSDSRKAEKIYNACVDIRRKLRDFLGIKDYETLLFDCERL